MIGNHVAMGVVDFGYAPAALSAWVSPGFKLESMVQVTISTKWLRNSRDITDFAVHLDGEFPQFRLTYKENLVVCIYVNVECTIHAIPLKACRSSA